jgi:hypothetical protein
MSEMQEVEIRGLSRNHVDDTFFIATTCNEMLFAVEEGVLNVTISLKDNILSVKSKVGKVSRRQEKQDDVKGVVKAIHTLKHMSNLKYSHYFYFTYGEIALSEDTVIAKCTISYDDKNLYNIICMLATEYKKNENSINGMGEALLAIKQRWDEYKQRNDMEYDPVFRTLISVGEDKIRYLSARNDRLKKTCSTIASRLP